MIEVSHLSKVYGTKRAVDDISFSVKPGEIIGFLGPNGAGKSTTMNMLTGYISASGGHILIDGHDILKDPREAKKRIGYLPEIPPLYLDMTLDEYLHFVYELKEVSLPEEKHLSEIKALTSLSKVGPRLLRNLSKGYRQRAGLAQALIGDPPVLILDEPTIGLDPTQIIEFRNVIKGLGKTTIFSTHILSEASAICTRMLIINQGKLIAEGDADALSGKNDYCYTLEIMGKSDAVQGTLSCTDGVKSVSVLDEKDSACTVSVLCTHDARPEIFRALSKAEMPILLLKKSVPTLEEIFLRAVSGKEEVTK